MSSDRLSIDDIIEKVQVDDLLNIKRFIIMTILYVIERTTLTELAKMCKMPLSTLQDNLKRLQELGYVNVRRAITTRGVRTIVEITEKGKRRYFEVYQLLKTFLDRVHGSEPR